MIRDERYLISQIIPLSQETVEIAFLKKILIIFKISIKYRTKHEYLQENANSNTVIAVRSFFKNSKLFCNLYL